jgi:hypothetical protein
MTIGEAVGCKNVVPLKHEATNRQQQPLFEKTVSKCSFFLLNAGNLLKTTSLLSVVLYPRVAATRLLQVLTVQRQQMAGGFPSEDYAARRRTVSCLRSDRA